jgi:uncharacterized protein (TIGR02145 family)
MKNLFRISGVILIIIPVFSAGCKKSDQGQLLEISTSVVVEVVTPTSAICSGKITSSLEPTISGWGVCWSTGHLPVITDNKDSNVPYNGYFSLTITGLSKQTDYYVRAYVTNSIGTDYGEELTFTTPADHTGETGTVEDADGNVYQTIGIGGQIWMTENLKTTRYGNGDLIGTTTPATLDISAEATPKYQWAYDGNESNVATYGRLYTWYAVTDTRNVCPTGWHVPTRAEFVTLPFFLGGGLVAGKKLKETGTTHWSYDEGATNSSGFTALPSASRSSIAPFSFWYDGDYGRWWSSTEQSSTNSFFWLIGSEWYIYASIDGKQGGYPVRCLRD